LETITQAVFAFTQNTVGAKRERSVVACDNI
jgi:hypothetical protein